MPLLKWHSFLVIDDFEKGVFIKQGLIMSDSRKRKHNLDDSHEKDDNEENQSDGSVVKKSKKILLEIQSAIKHILEPYGIHEKDAFSLFLPISEENMLFSESWIMHEDPIKSDCTYLEITLTRGANWLAYLPEVTEGLNTHLPALMAKEEPLAVSPSKAYVLRWCLNTTAVKTELLPWIRNELTTCPDKVLELCSYTSDEVMSKFKGIAASLGIDVARCDFIEETMCEVVNYYYNFTPEVFITLSSFLVPTVIIDLILSFSDAVPLAKALSSKLEIVTTKSMFKPVTNDVKTFFCTYQFETKKVDFKLETKANNGERIVDFFNNHFPKSACLKKTEDKENNSVTIRVHNAALMSNHFLDHYSAGNISTFHNPRRLEHYRKQSKLKKDPETHSLEELPKPVAP